MSVSEFYHIPFVLHVAGAVMPRRVLDVGVGTGTYGFLLRNLLDFAAGRTARADWQTTIDGIEIFAEYENPVWEHVYNSVLIGDMREQVPRAGHYDLILFNDVLEHVTRDEATALVDAALTRATCVIATTPHISWPQGAVHGNEAERHLCHLSAADFPGLLMSRRALSTTCYVCSRDPASGKRLVASSLRCPAYMPKWLQPKRLLRRFPHYVRHLAVRAGLRAGPVEREAPNSGG